MSVKDDLITKAYKNGICRVFSYQQFPFWVIDSVRGVGKTHSVQEFLLKGWFEHGYFFSLLRESEAELELMLNNGFWDIDLINREPYCKHKYDVRGKFIYIDGIIVGTAVALTTYAKYRQSGSKLGIRETFSKKREQQLKIELDLTVKEIDRSRDKLRYCFFDEFEPLEPLLSPEKRVKAFKHILENLFRMRRNGVHVILTANIVNAYSSILDILEFPETSALPEYGFFKSYTAKTHKRLAIRYRVKPPPEWFKLRDDSLVGLLTERTHDAIMYTGAATQGVNYKPRTAGAHRITLFNLLIGGNAFTIWKVKENANLQITPIGRNKQETYAMTAQDSNRNARVIPKPLRDILVEAFRKNQIEYNSGKEFELFRNSMPIR